MPVTITDLTPDFAGTGTVLVITGTMLDTAVAVVIDGVGRDFTIINSTTIHVTIPEMTEGPKNVYVNYF